MGKVRAESRYSAIGLINLDEKQTGAPSAGNPHAGCEVAGAGTRLTVRILRHFQRKREATDRLNLRGKWRQSSTLPNAAITSRWLFRKACHWLALLASGIRFSRCK